MHRRRPGQPPVGELGTHQLRGRSHEAPASPERLDWDGRAPMDLVPVGTSVFPHGSSLSPAHPREDKEPQIPAADRGSGLLSQHRHSLARKQRETTGTWPIGSSANLELWWSEGPYSGQATPRPHLHIGSPHSVQVPRRISNRPWGRRACCGLRARRRGTDRRRRRNHAVPDRPSAPAAIRSNTCRGARNRLESAGGVQSCAHPPEALPKTTNNQRMANSGLMLLALPKYKGMSL